MEQSVKTIALVYDFDGTLARGNLQEKDFISRFWEGGVADFWAEVKRRARNQDADEILTYMALMLDVAKTKEQPFTREDLNEMGKNPDYFDGVEDWFELIEQCLSDIQDGSHYELAHFCVSSGLREMIEGCSISRHFRKVFASGFAYGDDGRAKWPAVGLNYTTKTQFLFRINKGIDNSWNNEAVNRWVPEKKRPVPFSRMIYLGDGDTDIPSMKMVRFQGGHSIAVFDPDDWKTGKAAKKVQNLLSEDRCNYAVPADFKENSQLHVTVTSLIERIIRIEQDR